MGQDKVLLEAILKMRTFHFQDKVYKDAVPKRYIQLVYMNMTSTKDHQSIWLSQSTNFHYGQWTKLCIGKLDFLQLVWSGTFLMFHNAVVKLEMCEILLFWLGSC